MQGDMIMRRFPICLILAIGLAACQADDPPLEEAAAEPEFRTEPDVPEPEVATPEDQEAVEEVVQRRERLREELREHRRRAAEADTPAERDRGLTPPQSEWWSDESLVVELGLLEEQVHALEQATERRDQARRDVRYRMIELRRQMTRDVAEPGDRMPDETEASELRKRLTRERETIDRQWRAEVEGILKPDQLDQLEAVRPEALQQRTDRLPALQEERG
jgi:hypothetical protein